MSRSSTVLTASSTKLLTCMMNFLLVFTGEKEDDQPDCQGGQSWSGESKGEKRHSGNAHPARAVEHQTEQAHGYQGGDCLLYTSPSPRDGLLSRMPSSA